MPTNAEHPIFHKRGAARGSPHVFGHIVPGAQHGEYYAAKGDEMTDDNTQHFHTKAEALDYIGASGKDVGFVNVDSRGHQRVIERQF